MWIPSEQAGFQDLMDRHRGGRFVPGGAQKLWGCSRLKKSTGFRVHCSLIHLSRLVEKKELLNFLMNFKTHFPLLLVKTFGQKLKSGLVIHVFAVGL